MKFGGTRDTHLESCSNAGRPAGQRIGPVRASLLAVAICLWPFLSYTGNNITLGLAPSDVLGLGASLSVLVLFLGGLAAYALRGAHYGRCVCTLAVAAALFFCYDLIRDAMAGVALGHIRYAMPVWGVLFLVGSLAAWILLKRRASYLVLAAVVGATLLVPLGQIGWFYGERLTSEEIDAAQDNLEAGAAAASEAISSRPDVFYLIFDAYSRDDQLRKQFGFDNTAFLEELERQGFYVARKSRANYLRTFLSLSSTLSMAYHDTDGRFDLSVLQRVLHGANETVRRFRRLGYTFVYAVPNFWHGSHCTGIEDVCISPTVNIREYHRELLELTPLGHLAMFLVPDFVSRLFNTTGDVTLESVQTRLDGLPVRPLFVFGHLLFPHSPYRFNSDCSYRTDEAAEANGGYLDNLRCTNRQILNYIDWLLKNHPDAIVILQSDHGLLFGKHDNELDEQGLQVGLSWEAFDGRAGILNAWHLPRRCRRHLNPTLTAVNTFRLVFSCLEKKEPRFLEDRYFLSSYKTMMLKPYDGQDD